ncbi:4-alpha-glucanotransferase [Miltoncostaea marina]|uniref:4-alpha-glucanotransferase n=1 Tax=Miltoncostaea marina TaxID=2843215 RepID=UPI001C3D5620|nr:4-alpha-glucanotransferase [Miltoncostaea marina]
MTDDPTHLRGSGVLLHVGSLPGGTLAEARAFIDWLADAGQSWWQILPLTPPDENGSPYASPSAFAGRTDVLARPRARVTAAERADFHDRCAYWIDDWAGERGREALDDQVRFDREWAEVRAHARERGVRILGDLPFYVAPGAVDVSAHPEIFRDDLVAGVPPDAFSDDGQLWGNPTYDWTALRRGGDRWWIERLARTRELHDATRVDHFRAFVAWWGVPRGARTARSGRWHRGPGARVVEAARERLGSLPLVAEDLGVITEPVTRLMERLGLPGMRVLHFAFPGGPRNPHRPENHPRRCVAYAGTHDNDTSAGWWASAGDRARGALTRAAEAAGIHGEPPHRAMMRLALSSPAGLAILTAQDLLGLGSEARLNTPGVAGGNWAWRLVRGQLDAGLAAWLRDETERAGRLPAAA